MELGRQVSRRFETGAAKGIWSRMTGSHAEQTGLTCQGLNEEVLNDFTVHIGQPKIAACVAVG